jgi:hypothetical protein
MKSVVSAMSIGGENSERSIILVRSDISSFERHNRESRLVQEFEGALDRKPD